MAGGLPDYLVIGTMKSGTTSLFSWLCSLPGVYSPPVKEPNFFSDDAVWAKGLDWYRSLFEGAGGGDLVGEASVSYTSEQRSPATLERIQSVVPQARLVCVVRDPEQRARSHYRHQVQRNREHRRFGEAVADPASPYLARSRYWELVSPYLEVAGDRLLVVGFGELVGGDEAGWYRILDHLGLPHQAHGTEVLNVTAAKGRFTGPMRWVYDRGLVGVLDHVPARVRQAGRRLAIRESGEYRDLLASSNDEVPAPTFDEVWNEARRLEAAVGRPLFGKEPAAEAG